MANIEFFIDENLLGLDRYLDFYEIKENLMVLTSDEKLAKHCDAVGVGCIPRKLSDFAETVKKHAEAISSNKQ